MYFDEGSPRHILKEVLDPDNTLYDNRPYDNIFLNFKFFTYILLVLYYLLWLIISKDVARV